MSGEPPCADARYHPPLPELRREGPRPFVHRMLGEPGCARRRGEDARTSEQLPQRRLYYVQVQPGADTINFHDPRQQTGIIRAPVTELNAYNTDQVAVPVEIGALLLFPAWLPHSVSANRSERPRISVSFNLMFD